MTCLADLDTARTTTRMEVLVVDNASADGTPTMIERRYPWVDVSVLPANVGFARANNLAIRRCRAPAVLLLNPDTRIQPAAIHALLDEFAADPAVGLAGPRVVDEDGSTDPNCRRGFPTLLGVAGAVTGLDRRLGWRRLGEYRRPWLPFDEPADAVSLSGSVILARCAALDVIGGFDERFFMYGEDIDLCLRAADAGWRVRYTPAATVIHLGGGSPSSRETRRAWARAIGKIHRLHRPGIRGRLTAAICDVGGIVLSSLPQRTIRHRRSRNRSESSENLPATLDPS
jgi:GT2 family glycosyltransferase